MQLVKHVLMQARNREADPAIVLTTGIATYGMVARAIESAVARIAALGLKPGSIVVIDVRNPFHHSVLLVALLLSRLASASIQNRQHFAQTHIQPDAVLTDATDFVVEGATVAIVSEDWFVTDPARPVGYPRLLAMPSFQRPDEIIRVAFSSGPPATPRPSR